MRPKDLAREKAQDVATHLARAPQAPAASFPRHHVLQLQRTIGNHATRRLLSQVVQRRPVENKEVHRTQGRVKPALMARGTPMTGGSQVVQKKSAEGKATIKDVAVAAKMETKSANGVVKKEGAELVVDSKGFEAKAEVTITRGQGADEDFSPYVGFIQIERPATRGAVINVDGTNRTYAVEWKDSHLDVAKGHKRTQPWYADVAYEEADDESQTYEPYFNDTPGYTVAVKGGKDHKLVSTSGSEPFDYYLVASKKRKPGSAADVEVLASGRWTLDWTDGSITEGDAKPDTPDVLGGTLANEAAPDKQTIK